MMKKLIILFAVIACVSPAKSQSQAGQAPQVTGQDTTGALPRLEIPEITIVGKKAIMLPFARKGEIYDVPVYDAPPPDTSMIGGRQTISLPYGSLPRYEEHQDPWRASVEGAFGSFSTGRATGYLDYLTQRWGMSGSGGFGTTQGHTTNSSGSMVRLGLDAHTLVETDNDFLRAFRSSGGLDLRHDSYGMQIIPVERRKNAIGVRAQAGSVNRSGNVVDLTLAANITKITDAGSGIDSGVSAVSPDLRAHLATDAGRARFMADFAFTGSSLNYDHPSESPSLIGVNAGVRWQLSDQWLIQAGAIFQRGSGSSGDSRSLLAPAAVVTWQAEQDHEWNFWLQPEIHLTTYDDHFRQNPFLIREIAIRPERRPVRFGSTFSYKDRDLSILLGGSFTHSLDKDVTIADSAGHLALDYIDADQFSVTAEGTLYPESPLRLAFSGKVQPGREPGRSVQISMLPLAEAAVRGEADLGRTATVWSALEYRSKRNIDRDGRRTLGDVALVNAGLSMNAIPRTAISFEADNLFNTADQWWAGFVAPGRRFTVSAKVSLK